MSRPPFPFDNHTAAQKARLAEDAWNSRDPSRVALAYTPDSQWRNRGEFINGRDARLSFNANGQENSIIASSRKYRRTRVTASLYASPMNITTTAAIGFALMATKTGSSTQTG